MRQYHVLCTRGDSSEQNIFYNTTFQTVYGNVCVERGITRESTNHPVMHIAPCAQLAIDSFYHNQDQFNVLFPFLEQF